VRAPRTGRVRVFAVQADRTIKHWCDTRYGAAGGALFVLQTICYEKGITVPPLRIEARVPAMTKLLHKGEVGSRAVDSLSPYQRGLVRLVHPDHGQRYIRREDIPLACAMLYKRFTTYYGLFEPAPLLPWIVAQLWEIYHAEQFGAAIQWGYKPAVWAELLAARAPVTSAPGVSAWRTEDKRR